MSRLHIEYGLRWRWTGAKVKRSIANPETMVLVASEAGALVGFAIMKFGEETAHLMLLAVSPTSRRRGIGRGMIDWLEKSCITAGIQRVQLEVRSGNFPARHFYESLGYRYVGQIAGYYDQREAATLLGKSLVVSNRHIGSARD